MVERQPSKLNVASSNLVSRSINASLAQLVEHLTLNQEVTGSTLYDAPYISPVRSVVRTSDFHSGNRGSIPLRGTIKILNMVA